MKLKSLSVGNVMVLRRGALLSVFIASLLLSAGAASAQTGQQRIDAVSAHMKRLQKVSANLPAAAKARLSTGAQHLLHMARKWDEIGPQLSQSVTLSAPL